MNCYYNVEIQMAIGNDVTENLLRQLEECVGANDTDRDEVESYRAVLFFKSDVKPTDIRTRLKAILAMHNNRIHYIDVIFRWETEINADRFVLWSNGTEKDYTGRIYFEEDK